MFRVSFMKTAVFSLGQFPRPPHVSFAISTIQCLQCGTHSRKQIRHFRISFADHGERGCAPVRDTGRNGRVGVSISAGTRQTLFGDMVQGSRGILPLHTEECAEAADAQIGWRQNRRERIYMS